LTLNRKKEYSIQETPVKWSRQRENFTGQAEYRIKKIYHEIVKSEKPSPPMKLPDSPARWRRAGFGRQNSGLAKVN
jgi:hypothetical protein